MAPLGLAPLSLGSGKYQGTTPWFCYPSPLIVMSGPSYMPPHLIAKRWNVRPEVRPTIGFGAKLPQQTLMGSTCRVYYPFGAFFTMLESNCTLITKII